MTAPRKILAVAAASAALGLAALPAFANAAPAVDEYSPAVPTKGGDKPIGDGAGKGSLSAKDGSAIHNSDLTPAEKKLLARVAADPAGDSQSSSSGSDSSSALDTFTNPLVLAVIFLVLAIAIGLTVARQRHHDEESADASQQARGKASEQPTTPHGQIVAQKEDRAPGGTPGGARQAGTSGNA